MDTPSGFSSTRWTLVGRAGSESPEERRAALGELLRLYSPALHTYLVVKYRMDGQDAADLVQEFIAEKIWERDLVTRADPARGKFRTFLLTALDRFRIEVFRRRKPPIPVPVEENQELAAESSAFDAFDVAVSRR